MGPVAETLVESLVAGMRASVQGELTSRNKVVDDLLDLRLASRDNAATLAVVDRLLGELPGRTTVTNAWWLEALLEIERTPRAPMVAAAPIMAPPSSTERAADRSDKVAPPLPRRRPQS